MARAASVAGDAAAIGGRGVQIVERLDVGERGRTASAHAFRRRARCRSIAARHSSSRSGTSVAAADADGERCARAVAVERDLRRRRDEGEVAAPRIHLVEADADPRLGPNRKAHAGRDRRRPAARSIIGPMKKSPRRDVAGLAAGRERPASHRASPPPAAISAAGSPLASEPPMVPRSRVAACPTKGMAVASSGSAWRDERVALGHVLPGAGADGDGVPVFANAENAGECARYRPAATAAPAASPSSAPASGRPR